MPVERLASKAASRQIASHVADDLFFCGSGSNIIVKVCVGGWNTRYQMPPCI